MLTIGNEEFRNLEEQVEKNKSDILFILEEEGTLNQFGIKVVGQIANASNLPDPATYTGDFGDAYAVGTTSPYVMYIYTRANGTHPNNYWFNIGQFPMPGPPGATGATGAQGPQGLTGPVGPAGPQGKQGPQGIQGPTGPRGAQGLQGPQGPKGDPGQSFQIVGILNSTSMLPTPTEAIRNQAYLIPDATEPGTYDLYVITGTDNLVWENAGHVESVQGPKGDVGPQGPQGPQGPIGPQGPQGVQGIEGAEYLFYYGSDIHTPLEPSFQASVTLSNFNRTPVVGDYGIMIIDNPQGDSYIEVFNVIYIGETTCNITGVMYSRLTRRYYACNTTTPRVPVVGDLISKTKEPESNPLYEVKENDLMVALDTADIDGNVYLVLADIRSITKLTNGNLSVGATIQAVSRINGTDGKDGVQGPQGPQGERGPAGPGLETLTSLNLTIGEDTVAYNTTDGITVSSDGKIVYGADNKEQQFQSEYNLPIVALNGLSMYASQDGKRIQINATQIEDQDLTVTSFLPVNGTYYRHIGATNDTFYNNTIYLYDGSRYISLRNIPTLQSSVVGLQEQVNNLQGQISGNEPSSVSVILASSDWVADSTISPFTVKATKTLSSEVGGAIVMGQFDMVSLAYFTAEAVKARSAGMCIGAVPQASGSEITFYAVTAPTEQIQAIVIITPTTIKD